MSNKKQNEELQSRREFFKKAAKAALPVVGAVVMASMPFVKADASQTSQFCEYCSSGCTGSCQNTCMNLCKGQCDTSCYGTCRNSCQHHCTAMQAGY